MIIALNLAIAGVLSLLVVEGYATPVFTGDATYMTHGIAVLGAVSVLLSLWWAAWRCADPVRAVHWLGYLAQLLVGLGLLGTVVGFCMALAGVSASGVADVAAIGPMVSALLAGMGTALYTTLIGAVAAEWVKLNRQFIAVRGA